MVLEKILFFGLGSIGTRHLNLIKNYFNYDIYAFRSSKSRPVQGIVNINDINEALAIKPEIAFITNPTNLHVITAIKCLKAGIKNIFIEKPLSHNLENLDDLLKEINLNNAIVYVGYSMRHNPVIKRLKQLVDERINNIYYVETISSSYLPNWRSGRDYRDVYSAKKELGGGVILELIHEFDYNELLFGKIKSIEGMYGKISSLEIETDDFCDALLRFESNLIGTIHLDYFSFKERRTIRILSHDDEIIADLIDNKITILNNEDSSIEAFNFERNDYFQIQLEYFFNGVEKNSKEIHNVKEAKELLKKILEFKKHNNIIINSNK